MARSPLLRPPEAAEYLAVSEATLKDWRAETRTTGKQVGPRWVEWGQGTGTRIRYKLVELDRFIDACMERAS